jgi:hypothetical protein
VVLSWLDSAKVENVLPHLSCSIDLSVSSALSEHVHMCLSIEPLWTERGTNALTKTLFHAGCLPSAGWHCMKLPNETDAIGLLFSSRLSNVLHVK